MKRIIVSILIVWFLFCFSACKTEERTIEILSASQDLFVYKGTEEADVIAVDEEGYLYTATYIPKEKSESIKESEYVYEPSIQQFKVYDLEGNCVRQAEVGVGNGTIRFLTAEAGKLYCVVNKSTLENYMDTLYSIDIETWEVTEIYGFDSYRSISTLVHLDDYFYVLGMLEYPSAKNYVLHPDVIFYEYCDEAISRIKVGEEQIQEELFPVDFPIDIIGTKKNTLLIYHYNEEHGFGFLEFDPGAMTFSEVGWKKSSVRANHFTMCEDGFVFYKDSRIFYGTADGMEAEISSENVTIWCAPTYQKGFLFYINTIDGKRVERIGISDLMRENKVIRFLMHEDTMDKPYGYGYRMEKQILDSEAYALKVLARDSDFDMYLLSSRNPISYNVKENGASYALNEVEGVQEYLNACFPYLKELAVNEEGDIWMIPVGLAIPVLLYHKEYCVDNEIELSEMDFSKFLTLVEKVETNTPNQGSISTYVMIEELFGQYLSRYDTFDTDVFRNYAKQIKLLCENAGKLVFDSVILLEDLQVGNVPEILYDYNVYTYRLFQYARKLGTLEGLGVAGVPSMSEELGNVGTLTFLAVNPQSENLETTLEYISDFCHYMLNKKDSFLLEDIASYTDTPFIKEWYQVYAEGNVYFSMDREVYWNTFYDYLNKKIELEEMIKEIERKREIYVGE